MKALLTVLVSVFAVSASADYTFSCASGTNSGDVVTVSGCMGEDGYLVECAGDNYPYLTVTKELWSSAWKTAPVINITKMPITVVDVQVNAEEEASVAIELIDDTYGKMKLDWTGGEGAGGTWVLDMPSMKNSFKVVGCQVN